MILPRTLLDEPAHYFHIFGRIDQLLFLERPARIRLQIGDFPAFTVRVLPGWRS